MSMYKVTEADTTKFISVLIEDSVLIQVDEDEETDAEATLFHFHTQSKPTLAQTNTLRIIQPRSAIEDISDADSDYLMPATRPSDADRPSPLLTSLSPLPNSLSSRGVGSAFHPTASSANAPTFGHAVSSPRDPLPISRDSSVSIPRTVAVRAVNQRPVESKDPPMNSPNGSATRLSQPTRPSAPTSVLGSPPASSTASTISGFPPPTRPGAAAWGASLSGANDPRIRNQSWTSAVAVAGLAESRYAPTGTAAATPAVTPVASPAPTPAVTPTVTSAVTPSGAIIPSADASDRLGDGPAAAALRAHLQADHAPGAAIGSSVASSTEADYGGWMDPAGPYPASSAPAAVAPSAAAGGPRPADAAALRAGLRQQGLPGSPATGGPPPSLGGALGIGANSVTSPTSLPQRAHAWQPANEEDRDAAQRGAGEEGSSPAAVRPATSPSLSRPDTGDLASRSAARAAAATAGTAAAAAVGTDAHTAPLGDVAGLVSSSGDSVTHDRAGDHERASLDSAIREATASGLTLRRVPSYRVDVSATATPPPPMGGALGIGTDARRAALGAPAPTSDPYNMSMRSLSSAVPAPGRCNSVVAPRAVASGPVGGAGDMRGCAAAQRAQRPLLIEELLMLRERSSWRPVGAVPSALEDASGAVSPTVSIDMNMSRQMLLPTSGGHRVPTLAQFLDPPGYLAFERLATASDRAALSGISLPAVRSSVSHTISPTGTRPAGGTAFPDAMTPTMPMLDFGGEAGRPDGLTSRSPHGPKATSAFVIDAASSSTIAAVPPAAGNSRVRSPFMPSPAPTMEADTLASIIEAVTTAVAAQATAPHVYAYVHAVCAAFLVAGTAAAALAVTPFAVSAAPSTVLIAAFAVAAVLVALAIAVVTCIVVTRSRRSAVRLAHSDGAAAHAMLTSFIEASNAAADTRRARRARAEAALRARRDKRDGVRARRVRALEARWASFANASRTAGLERGMAVSSVFAGTSGPPGGPMRAGSVTNLSRTSTAAASASATVDAVDRMLGSLSIGTSCRGGLRWQRVAGPIASVPIGVGSPFPGAVVDSVMWSGRSPSSAPLHNLSSTSGGLVDTAAAAAAAIAAAGGADGDVAVRNSVMLSPTDVDPRANASMANRGSFLSVGEPRAESIPHTAVPPPLLPASLLVHLSSANRPGDSLEHDVQLYMKPVGPSLTQRAVGYSTVARTVIDMVVASSRHACADSAMKASLPMAMVWSALVTGGMSLLLVIRDSIEPRGRIAGLVVVLIVAICLLLVSVGVIRLTSWFAEDITAQARAAADHMLESVQRSIAGDDDALDAAAEAQLFRCADDADAAEDNLHMFRLQMLRSQMEFHAQLLSNHINQTTAVSATTS